jgi:IPT/TIG domain/Glucodextranase, domain B
MEPYMRVRAALFAILCVILSAPLAAQTFVQSNITNDPNGNGTDNLTYTCAYPQSNASGNTLVLAIRNNLPVQSVTDSEGNNWVSVVNGSVVGLWYAINSKAGTNTVTITFSSAQPLQAVCAEYSGLYLLDQVSQMARNESSTATSPTLTTASANELIFGFGTNDTANGAGGVRSDLTAGTGFTLRGNANIFLEDLVQSAAGTVNSVMNYGASVVWNQWGAAFRPMPAGSPVITGINPTFGPVGLQVTISGTNFASPQAGNSVTFNGTAATPTNWNGSQIVTPVPSGAASGDIVVNIGGTSSNHVAFEVTPAVEYGTVNQPNGNGTDNLTYTCTYPQGNRAGDTLVFAVNGGLSAQSVTDSQGNNWVPVVNGPIELWYAINSKAGANVVTLTFPAAQVLQAVCAEYSGLYLLDQVSQIASGESSTATSPNITTSSANDLVIGFGINFTTNGPNLTPGTGFTLRGSANVFLEDKVQSAAGTTNSTMNYGAVVDWNQAVAAFTPFATGSPVITGISPTFGPAGLPVTINGTNFGTLQGSSVTFNGTPATPTSLSSTQIVVPVPAGASSGPIVVTVGGTASNQVAFEVTQALQYGTVNEPNGNGGDNLIYTCAYPQGNRAGNTLVIAVRGGYPAQSVTDSQGNTWIPVVNGPTELWYATNSKAGANTVTVTYSTAQPLQAVCAEYSGSWVLDQTSQVTPGNGTQATSPSITTSASGDLILGFGTYNAYSTITPQSGFGLRSGVNIFIEDGLQQAAGPIASSVTYVAATDWTQGIAAFKAGSLPTSQSPFITHVNKSSSGNTVTIIGGNFGSTRGQSTVAFNDGHLLALVTTWSDTQIVVPVPTGAVTGSIFVAIGGDTVVPIQNPSFEIAGTLDQACFVGCFNSGPIPSWTIAGSQSGSWQPNNNYYTAPFADGGSIIAYDGGGTISQTLTGISLQPNTTYKLTVGVGQRLDNLIANYSISLMAGSTVVATQSGSNATIPAGSFVDQTLVYSTNGIVTSGDLSIVLSSDGSQIGFDNVRLTVGNQPIQSSATWYFTPTSSGATAPNISNVSPTQGSIGTPVTITGTNFGGNPGVGTVNFSGATGIPTSWTDTQIVVPVPNGAITGPVSVTVGGTTSNQTNFVVGIPPSIIASVYPPPNANGWNNSDVTVNFTCTAGSSPIVTCPPTQNVTSEGAHQVISGVTADTNGLNATASVTLSIDRTNPILTGTVPADGTMVASASVSVTGLVSDFTSGTSAMTCNGVPASVTSGTFSCNVSLTAGVNLIGIRATDFAGNAVGSNVHVNLTGPIPTPNSLQVTPANVTMSLNELRTFTLVDEHGRPRTDATWMVSDSSIASISSDSSTVLTALSAGQVTLTGSAGGLTAQTTINVLGGLVTPGTALWSVSSSSQLPIQQCAQAKVQTLGSPALYCIESDGSTNAVIALTSDGQQLWTSQVSGESIDGVVVIPDGNGGVIVHIHPLRSRERFVDLDAQTGSVLWEHDSNLDSERFRGVAIGADGTVYFREYTVAPDLVVAGQTDILWSLVGLDGSSGAVVFNYPVPQSKQTIGDFVLATNLSQLSDPIIGPDGAVYATVVTVDQPVVNVAYNQTILLLKGTTVPYPGAQFSGPGGRVTVGTPTTTLIAQIDFNGVALSNVSAQFVQLTGLIPNGESGVLASWWTQQFLPNSTVENINHITNISSGGVSDFLFRTSAPFAFPIQSDSMVLGENGTAFATDGQTVAAFNVDSGAVTWTYQASGTYSIVAAESGNQIIGKVTDQNNLDTVVNLDASGAPTVAGWSAPAQQFQAGSSWLSVSNGILQSVLGWTFDLPVSAWPFNSQKDTHAATYQINLNVLKINEANIDDSFVQARIKTATDYWQKQGVLFNWSGSVQGIPACDPTLIHCDPNTTPDQYLFSVSSQGQLDEVYRRFVFDPGTGGVKLVRQGLTVLFVNALPCLPKEVAAYTLTNSLGDQARGRQLNFIMAAHISCTIGSSESDDVLDHEFGHAFQLQHVGTGGTAILSLLEPFLLGGEVPITPLTNLMCGPTGDEGFVDNILESCSVSRLTRYLTVDQFTTSVLWAVDVLSTPKN